MLVVGVSDKIMHATCGKDITVLHRQFAWIRQSGMKSFQNMLRKAFFTIFVTV